jgi:predicted dehydrogenase
MKYLIVGYGNIGHKREKILGNKCLATVDPDPKQKANYKLSSTVPTKILNKIRAVVIATPRQPKLALVEYWLKKGKNVLVEKPLILAPIKAKFLASLALKNKVIWYTGYNHHFEENIIRLQKMLAIGKIGKLYHARLEYSFGNVKEIIGTWRETGYGDLDEAGCHLVDFARIFFGYKGSNFKSVSLRKIESKVFDQCIFSTTDNKIIFEAGWTTWKNVFKIDIYGSLGSLHLEGLRKWGKSKLTYRQRVFPAGVPVEKVFIENGPDNTWQKDISYFEKMIKTQKNSLISDIENTKALVSIALSDNPKDTKIVYQKLQGLADNYSHVI